jgi:hypothetical protein
MVREAFVHDAVVAMQPGASPEALGGAITIALCGRQSPMTGSRLPVEHIHGQGSVRKPLLRSSGDELRPR